MDTILTPDRKNPEIEATFATNINLALAQNSVPIIRDLAVVNPTGCSLLEELTLRIEPDPAFCVPVEVTIDRLGEDIRLAINNAEPKLNLTYLRGLSEAVNGSLRFTLRNKSGDILAELFREVRVLARDEWGGTGSLPELIAAFVQPNDPAIGPLLREVIENLRQGGLRDALDGYTNRSQREAAQLVATVWRVICTLGLGYALPPASFERVGQKIRLPSRVLNERIGSCLDLTLLFASLLEQAGFRPLILFKQGHAFVGCWLKDEDFSAPVIDDVQAIRKRQKLGELLVFEVTFVAQGTPSRFNFSCQAAVKFLEEEESFICAVDIARTRQTGIKPVVYDESQAGPVVNAPVGPGIDVGLDIPPDIPDVVETIEAEVQAPITSPNARVLRWKRKLLDLTLRNPLLNFRADQRAITMICPDPALLEDKIAAGHNIKILPLPDFGGERDPRNIELRNRREQDDLLDQHAREALARKELVTRHEEQELDARLINLFRLAKTALEEGGANVLWLAIGMLSWKPLDARQPNTPSYRAPLVMLPVELVRRSVGSKPFLRMHDENARLNDTLFQMLRQDFQLIIDRFEGELPTDESGLDVPLILATMRHAIRDLRGWELRDQVLLSTWSFAKFLMYKDLEARSEELKQAPIVRHLIETPDDIFNDYIDFPAPKTLDEIEPSDLCVPMGADSSQLAAIVAAAKGKTFVLRGPPGTGKSQTITNIIAHSLGKGKRVLFVAEKTAALDAVYSRLDKICLGKYCLQLHSNKTSKEKFVTQLHTAWNEWSEFDERTWLKACTDLQHRRDSLNKYVRALHKRYRNGWTVFRAIGEVSRFRKAPQLELGRVIEVGTGEAGKAMREALGWTDPDTHTEEEFTGLLDIVRRMDVNIKESRGLYAHPFSEIVRGGWSPSWQSELMSVARKIKPVIDRVEHATQNFVRAIGLPGAPLSEARFEALQALPSLLVSVYGEQYGSLIGLQGHEVKRLKEASTIYANYQGSLDRCSVQYMRSVFAVDLDTLNTNWETSTESKWPRSLFLRRKVKGILRKHTLNKVEPDPDRDLPALQEAAGFALETVEYTDLLQSVEGLWCGLDTDPGHLQAALAWRDKIYNIIGQLTPEPDAWELYRSALIRLTVEQNERLGEEGPVWKIGLAFQNVAKELEEVRGAAAQLAGGVIALGCDDLLGALRSLADEWLASESRLRTWCAWRAVRAEAVQRDLTPLIEALENNIAPGMTAEDLFVSGYAKWFLHAAVDRDDVLCHFVSREHELRISEFADLDERIRDYTAEYIRLQLRKPVPQQGSSSDSAWGRLNRELNRRRGHTPIRKMLSEVPEPILTLTPCLMMSPISVAQYLDPAAPLFDLVIFDEASQIPTYDAIGALARAKQAVIAGDDKQLPPTSFFDRQDDQDDDISSETPDDLESILDECNAARVPIMGLNWHYRSRDESLIAFSNHRYYLGNLITFPSPNTEGTAVNLHYVEGAVYDRGKSRTNLVEAQRVVQHVTSMMRHPNYNDRSFGVVTFNSQQQNLIQNLIEEEVRRDHALEWFFNEEHEEPYFTKNLESVQGDERDIIIFSITYGPDHLGGRVSMNFGPLNKPGGQRRLNVAVSRAKHAMHVFSSFRPEDIDLNRTAAEGVRDLKLFLDYSLNGPRSLYAGPTYSLGSHESPLEAQVADALRGYGWAVHTQIGVGPFRVDLGVVHPVHPGRFLAGVECDGATYHRSVTARDRDFLRQQVLEELGWKIFRVWSTDFWLDPMGTIKAVDEALQKIIQEEEENKVQDITLGSDEENSLTDKQEEPKMAQFPSGRTSDTPLDTLPLYSGLEPNRVEPGLKEMKPSQETDSDLTNDEDSEPNEDVQNEFSGNQVPYSHWNAHTLPDPRNASIDQVVTGLVEIISAEGPLFGHCVYFIYARAVDPPILRVGNQIRDIFNKALRKALQQKLIECNEDGPRVQEFYLQIVRKTGSKPIVVRTRGNREFSEIPPGELGTMMIYLYKQNPTQEEEQLLKSLAETFEIGRITENIRDRLKKIKTQFLSGNNTTK